VNNPTATKPSLGLKARVAVTQLNIRSAPSISSQDLGDLKEGDMLTVLDLSGNDMWVRFGENKWAAHTSGGNPYLSLVAGSSQLKARVLVNRLNIRSGPGTNYRDIGDLTLNDEINVYGIGGRDVWVKFESGKWAAMLQGSKTYMTLLAA